MLVPAIQYKDEIENEFQKIQYTDKYLWYTGSIDNYDIEVKTEGDKFAFAIVAKNADWYGEVVIGYISFRVDWYCSMAYNFGLIRFSDAFVEVGGAATRIMASAIREVMRMIESFNLHRIDFRCVSGNPAEKKYESICWKIKDKGEYRTHYQIFHDNIKDRQGTYHDTICYELIRRGA
jgi:RimJ/RimL family protein N-acetyltransferase